MFIKYEISMVNKVEHHISNKKQIDKLKNITEKSIFLALEENGLR